MTALRRAVAGLVSGLAAPRVASLYLTAPLSSLAQPDFLNTAVVGEATTTAREWLDFVLRLEERSGRRRSPDAGPPAPRALDIDIIWWGDLVSTAPDLVLPHPRARERRFVLEPLAEIAPEQPLPPDGETIERLLAALFGHGGSAQRVERIAGPGWQG